MGLHQLTQNIKTEKGIPLDFSFSAPIEHYTPEPVIEYNYQWRYTKGIWSFITSSTTSF